MEAMQGDLDETDDDAVAEARVLIDRAQRVLPSSLRTDVGPMLDLMERGIAAAEDGDDPNSVFGNNDESLAVMMDAAEAMQDYRVEECGADPEAP